MADSAGKKVLVVDDDPGTVRLLTTVLGRAGYATVSAPDAQAGLEKIRSEKPDLVVLDVMMPSGTEGFHLVWELRGESDPAVRDVPIIMLTGIHDTTDLRFYPDQTDGTYKPYEYLPVQAFLDKPVDSEKLLEEVGRILK